MFINYSKDKLINLQLDVWELRIPWQVYIDGTGSIIFFIPIVSVSSLTNGKQAGNWVYLQIYLCFILTFMSSEVYWNTFTPLKNIFFTKKNPQHFHLLTYRAFFLSKGVVRTHIKQKWILFIHLFPCIGFIRLILCEVNKNF